MNFYFYKSVRAGPPVNTKENLIDKGKGLVEVTARYSVGPNFEACILLIIQTFRQAWLLVVDVISFADLLTLLRGTQVVVLAPSLSQAVPARPLSSTGGWPALAGRAADSQGFGQGVPREAGRINACFSRAFIRRKLQVSLDLIGNVTS
jgi:hypothetical protein